MIKKLLQFTVLAFFLVGCDVVFADVTVLQNGTDGYTGSAFAFINSGSSNQHSTENAYMSYLDYWPIIGWFDVSSVGTVSSAILEIRMEEVASCTAETAEVKAIEDPDGTGAFDFATTSGDYFNDYATWRYKDHGSSIEWSSGEGNNFGDVDDNTPAATASVAGCSSRAWKSFDITTLVQGWQSNPSSNSGFYLDCSDSCSIAIDGNWNGTTANRPKLTITHAGGGGGYTPGPGGSGPVNFKKSVLQKMVVAK